MNGRYILFSQPQHDSIRLDFTHQQIKRFIELWKEGFNIGQIGRKMDLRKSELELIRMDLEIAGKIKKQPLMVKGHE